MKKILVVDDECPIVDAIKFFLEKSGQYQVTEIHDEKDVLNLLQKEFLNLAIVDVDLSNGSGRRVIEAAKGKGIKVIGITDNLFLECSETDMMCKPFSSKDLVARVKETLG